MRDTSQASGTHLDLVQCQLFILFNTRVRNAVQPKLSSNRGYFSETLRHRQQQLLRTDSNVT